MHVFARVYAQIISILVCRSSFDTRRVEEGGSGRVRMSEVHLVAVGLERVVLFLISSDASNWSKLSTPICGMIY